LLHWILNTPDQELNGWANAHWNGMTTLQLAKCIERYIHNPVISGVYHLVNNRISINKYDLLCLVNDVYGLGKTVRNTQGPKDINKILIDTRNLVDFEIPDYTVQLQQLKDFV